MIGIEVLADTELATADRNEAVRRAEEWQVAMFELLEHRSVEEVDRLWEQQRNKVIRRWAMRRARQRLISRLSTSLSAADVLSELLRAGRQAGVQRIRFYSCQAGTGMLESVDSAGHDPHEEMLLRLGTVKRTRKACPTDRSDAFVCIDSGRPTLFTIDPTLAQPLVEDTAGQTCELSRVRQREWQTGEVLPQACLHRVEIPLIHMGEVIGKLSCALAERRSLPSERRLMWFCKLAGRAGAVLHAMQIPRTITVRSTFDIIRDEIIATGTLSQLFDYCAVGMPKHVQTLHASVFTAHTDDIKTRRLVLRRTSYLKSRPLEDGGTDSLGRKGYYTLDDAYSSITAFSAIQQRPIRLQGLNREDSVFQAQLRLIDPNLRWSNAIQDSESHSSLLVVPLLWQKQLIGVVRFTEKAGPDCYFTQADERLLTSVAANILAPHLRMLLDREADRRFGDLGVDDRIADGLAQAFVGADAGSKRKQQVNALGQTMNRLTDSSGLHLYLANRERKGEPGKITSVPAGNLSWKPSSGKLSDSPLTKLVFDEVRQETGDRKPRCLYFHDVQKAEEAKMLRKLSPDTACALACPIRLSDNQWGVLVLQSNKLDIIPEVVKPLIERFSQRTPPAVERLLNKAGNPRR